MNEELFENLSWVSSYLVIAPLIVFLVRRKKLNLVQRKLVALLLLILLTEIASNILWYEFITNHPLYHFYSIIEFLLILNLYASILSEWISKKWFFITGSCFVVFAVGNMLFLQNLFEFNSNVTTLSAFFIILLTIFTYFHFLHRSSDQSLSRTPAFWINTGLLLYFSSNLVLFYVGNKVDLTLDESYTIWGLHSIFNCVQITLFTLALWIHPKKD